ncbi:hypothetical protein [Achromobacter xylosoxidans]|uniref:hypothetical protein n=1 Tax=Alcaligenes xylosoxydans xylosoxydans TaxID=85698 RepID=UPI003FD87AE6
MALVDLPQRLGGPGLPGPQRPGRPGAAGFPPATPGSAGNWLGRDDRGHQQRPAVATDADLKDTRQILEARAAQVEKSLSGYAAADDLQALRAEVEQIKARQAAARATAPAQRRASRTSAASKTELPPLPFRVVGAELRAGQRSVSVAPSIGDFTPAQLQVLLPGDAVGPWRLQAIEGNTAVFQAGNQTRRVAIP